MEKEGTPYKLEICHNKFSEAGPLLGGAFRDELQGEELGSVRKGVGRQGTEVLRNRGEKRRRNIRFTKRPNGISIKLFRALIPHL